MNPTLQRSVFLIDDEKSYTDLMAPLLAESLACPVHGFTQPLEALEKVTELAPAVIVTDYNMPVMDGIEFIRQAAPRVPVTAFILISGQNLAGKETQLARLAALKGVVAKPVGWKQLSEEIVRVWPAGTPPPALRREAP